MPWVAQLTSPMEAFGPWCSCGGMISNPFCYLGVLFLSNFCGFGSHSRSAWLPWVHLLAPSSTGSAIVSDFCEKSPNGWLLGSLEHPWGTLGLHGGALGAPNVPKCEKQSGSCRFSKVGVLLCVFFTL